MIISLSLRGFNINLIMPDIDNDYEDYSMEMETACFSNDFDEVGWDPVEIDDSNEEAKELYGY